MRFLHRGERLRKMAARPLLRTASATVSELGGTRAALRPAAAAALPTLNLADRARRAALLGHRIAEPGGTPIGDLQRWSGLPLTMGEPGDPFERQADAVAERIATGGR